MPTEEWGSAEWNDNHFPADKLDTEGDTWGIRWRGMEKMRHQSYLRIVRPDLETSSPIDVLDIGCALCDFTHKAWEVNKSNRFWGMDISQNAISWNSKKFPEFTFKVGAAPDIPFDVEFDLIFFLEIMCYLSAEDRKIAIRNVFDKLKPGGKLLFSGVLDGGVQHHTTEEVIELIGNVLTIEKTFFNHWSWHRKIIDRPFSAMDSKLSALLPKLRMTRAEFDEKHGGSGSGMKMTVLRTLRALSPVSNWFLQSISWIARGIVSWKLPAVTFHNVSRLIKGAEKADEIVVLAKKLEDR